jgi:hypothetical protein
LNQGFMLAKQALYHLAIVELGSHDICPDWP